MHKQAQSNGTTHKPTTITTEDTGTNTHTKRTEVIMKNAVQTSKIKQYREYNAIFKRIQHTLKSMLEHELKNVHNIFFYSGDFWISYLPSIFFFIRRCLK